MLKTLTALSLTLLLFAGIAFAHGDATHLKGTVTAIDAAHSTFTIKQTDGKPVNVMTNKSTKYLDSKDKPAANSELKVGARVVVDAKMDTTAKMYVAEEVHFGAAPAAAAKPAAKPAAGK